MPSPWTTELRETLRLGAPLAAAHAGMQLMGLVDAAVVGRLGAVELGAIGIGNALFFFFGIFASGVVLGIDPLIAQALGAGDEARARRALWQGVWLALVIGIATSIPMALSPAILSWMKVDAAVTPLATSYLLIRTLSLLPVLFYWVARSYLQARFVTRPIVLSMVIGNVFNLAADIVLVHGGRVLPPVAGFLRDIPAMGVEGAAVATVLGSFLQLWIVVVGLNSLDPSITAAGRRLVRREFAGAFRLGLPIGLHMGVEIAVFALAGILAGRLGPVDLAAHQIALTLAAMSFTVVVGIGTAGSVRVGRAIGARDAHGTRLAGAVAFATGTGVMCLAAILFRTAPGPLARMFTSASDVIARTAPLLAVAAVFQIADGIQGVGAGVLRGAGDTRFTFVSNLVGHWLIGFPIALFLGFRMGHGVVGLWWGLCAGLIAVAIALLTRFLVIASREIRPLADRE